MSKNSCLKCQINFRRDAAITKTEVVGQMSRCQGASRTMAASLAMTRNLVVCQPDELLQDLWKRMKERKLKNIPVVDQDGPRSRHFQAFEQGRHFFTARRCGFSFLYQEGQGQSRHHIQAG